MNYFLSLYLRLRVVDQHGKCGRIKKKHITSDNVPTTTACSSPNFPDQQEFHQHLRELIRGATRVVMEEIMQEELCQFLQAAWGESTPSRQGYRNGSYTRDLVTTGGQIENLRVPRDREGQFHTQAFERYSRYEPQVAAALTEMFVSGSSTHKVGEVTKTLLGMAPSASTVSRLNHAQRYPEAVRSLSEDEEHLLTFYAFPSSMYRHIQTTNAIESFFSNVRQRTDQIDAFTTETSCICIVCAVMQNIRFHKVTVY